MVSYNNKNIFLSEKFNIGISVNKDNKKLISNNDLGKLLNIFPEYGVFAKTKSGVIIYTKKVDDNEDLDVLIYPICKNNLIFTNELIARHKRPDKNFDYSIFNKDLNKCVDVRGQVIYFMNGIESGFEMNVNLTLDGHLIDINQREM